MSRLYLTTFGGIQFDPLDPKPEDIVIEDIAHSLSIVNRYCGHTPYPYSVAKHSVMCAHEARAREYPVNIQLGCLLHDAAEAYLNDVTRPVKVLIPEYGKVEDELLDIIFKKFDLNFSKEEMDIIYNIDDVILKYEYRKLFNRDLNHLNVDDVVMEHSTLYSPWDYDKHEFLKESTKLFHLLS